MTNLYREKIQVLDKGFIRLVEAYGGGDNQFEGENPDNEAGIIEAARQSTQGNFRGWDKWKCNECGREFPEKNDSHQIDWTIKCPVSKGWTNDEKLLAFLNNNTHTTPFEFAGMVIETKMPIFVIREWHRHRTQSYNEMSARYAPLPDDNYVPTMERLFLSHEKNKQAQAVKGAKELDEGNAKLWLAMLRDFYADAEAIYQAGLQIGIPKEVARIVLPVGRYTQMRASANLLNWLKFCSLRSTKSNPHAQYEIRMFADALEQIMEKTFPRAFGLFDKLRTTLQETK